MPSIGGRRNNAGRKPIPLALAALRGNPGHRPIRENAVKPGAFTGSPPDWLGATALAWWREHEEAYVRLGLLTELSEPAYAMLCDAWGTWIDLRRAVDAVTEASLERAHSRICRWAPEFGIGPASLSRITAAGASGEADPVADYRAKRSGAA